MVAVIFGKPSELILNIILSNRNMIRQLTLLKIYAGPRSKNLSQDPLIKLKAVYTLVEQLYIGAQWALAAISPTNQ